LLRFNLKAQPITHENLLPDSGPNLPARINAMYRLGVNVFFNGSSVTYSMK
jgi:hypothetical protein